MQRTEQDINRDLARNDARGFIIGLYEKYPNLDISDICLILSDRLNSELNSLKIHYNISPKDNN